MPCQDRDDAEAAEQLDDERREHERAVRHRHAAAKRQRQGSFRGASSSPASSISPRSQGSKGGGAKAGGSPRPSPQGRAGTDGFDHLWAASAQSHEAALHHEPVY